MNDYATTHNAAIQTLDLFGQYGGLIGLIIGALFLLLSVLIFINARSRDKQMQFQNDQIAGFAQAISTQSQQMATAIETGLRDQAETFLRGLESIRADHRAERDRDRQDRENLLKTVERLAGAKKAGRSATQGTRRRSTAPAHLLT